MIHDPYLVNRNQQEIFGIKPGINVSVILNHVKEN